MSFNWVTTNSNVALTALFALAPVPFSSSSARTSIGWALPARCSSPIACNTEIRPGPPSTPPMAPTAPPVSALIFHVTIRRVSADAKEKELAKSNARPIVAKRRTRTVINRGFFMAIRGFNGSATLVCGQTEAPSTWDATLRITPPRRNSTVMLRSGIRAIESNSTKSIALQ